ncbi:MAG: hypothetical protein RIB86_17445, partial [Imperialibacter sp.]
MIKLVPTLSLVVFIILFSCQSSSEKQDWQILFNGEDLTGWDTYLGQEWTQVNDSTFRPVGEPVG